jgi:SMI1 / KNR4 family (SUKH-1)
VDSDLADALSALRDGFHNRKIGASFGRADEQLVATLRSKFRLPRRYRDFLLEADPVQVETRTPSERIRLIPASELIQEQKGFCLLDSGEPLSRPSSNGWRPSWVIVGHSTLLGDPYFLDTSLPDAEGDCPVYTAMSGTDQWKPRLCASSFALFVRILAIGMELAEDFADDHIDVDDETVFRETFGPRIRQFDPAALKAGHWT